MWMFGYLQIILRSPYESAPLTVLCRDLDAILDNFESHMVPEEHHRVLDHV